MILGSLSGEFKLAAVYVCVGGGSHCPYMEANLHHNSN